MKQIQQVNLLNELGIPFSTLLKFIQTICYAGLETESLVKSRGRLYKKI